MQIDGQTTWVSDSNEKAHYFDLSNIFGTVLMSSESHSVMSDSCDPMESMEISRPGYWSGQPFPSPGNLPNPGIKPRSLALQMDSLPTEHKGSPRILEWVAYPFSSRSSQPRNPPGSPALQTDFYQLSYQGRTAFRVFKYIYTFLCKFVYVVHAYVFVKEEGKKDEKRKREK